MSVTSIRWLPHEGYDIHVLRGGTASRRLDEILILDLSDGSAVLGDSLPSSVTLAFVAEFAGAPKAHGVEVDGSFGFVIAAKAPAPLLRNFLIRAEVKDPSATQPIESIKIRVHVHSAINGIRLTPDPLTVHTNVAGFQFTLLAEFDDGTVGDISDWPGLTWTSSSPSKVSVDAKIGELKASEIGASIDVKVTLSAAQGGKTATATIKTLAPWGQALELTWVNGKGKSKFNEALNILFLPEGFSKSEQTLFEAIVRGIVDELRDNWMTSPFDLFRKSINYWMTFVPSRETGTSVLPECYFRSFSTDGILWKASAIGLPVVPAASPATTAWNLQELIHEVGLPVGTDVLGRQLDTGANPILNDLQKLYGNKVTKPRVQTLFSTWQGIIAQRALLNEVDTAFGLAQGERPRVQELKESHWISFHPRRTSLDLLFSLAGDLKQDLDGNNFQNVQQKFRTKGVELSKATVISKEKTTGRWLVIDLDNGRTFSVRDEGSSNLNVYEKFSLKHFLTFLENLTLKSEKAGKTWTTGKDKGLVCFIARTRRKGGLNTGRYYTASLGTEDEDVITASANVTINQSVYALDPMPIPSKATITTVGVVAHETGHSFQFGNLGDEYSNFGRFGLTEKRAKRLSTRGNLQGEKDLLKDPAKPTSGLDGTKIKWARGDVREELWPRIKVAGLLKEKPKAVGGDFEITLESQHGKPFAALDKNKVFAHLRRRPLLKNATLSTPMSIQKVTGDKIQVRLFGGLVPPFDPDSFPPGSILLVPGLEVVAPPAIGNALPIVAPFIRDHITSSGKPLKSSRTDKGVCINADLIKSRTPDNLPAGIKPGKPKFHALITGLYEGGDTYNCGVYHSTGICLMRWTREIPGAAGQIYQFCHVCRYIMVDAIDPTKHGEIDNDHENNFPEHV